jgi:uncharacterized glyoxalase superfamily protein PhnB
MKIPEGYQQVMPYLIVKDAAGFMRFMENVFGAKEKFKMMRGESVIMLADSTDAFKPRTAGMFVYVEDADETYHKALNEGATSIMLPSDQEYGRTCGITDPFGNVWWPTAGKG